MGTGDIQVGPGSVVDDRTFPLFALTAAHPPSVNVVKTTPSCNAGVPRMPPLGSNPPSCTDHTTGSFGFRGSSFMSDPTSWSRVWERVGTFSEACRAT